ncbi:MAG: DUF547 domain-containing protein [Lewinellaceae bacterium]|nr:DUF547 domain-containing protein [Lewinellaceae bacterium]
MLSRSLVVTIALLSLFLGSCKVRDYTSASTPINHQVWDELLQAHVDTDGWVNYPGFIRDSARLNQYLATLSQAHPNPANWTREEQMAYWINAYNAFTVQLIIRHYPVASIKDIKRGIPFVNTVWDLKFIQIEGATYDLNNLEHGILRPKFAEPRVHFALNCASVSCPKLQNHAFTANNLNQQLDQAAREFINDPSRNRLTKDAASLSMIFNWYGGDFKKEAPVLDFINRYSTVKIKADAKVDYLDYDWNLNEKR